MYYFPSANGVFHLCQNKNSNNNNNNKSWKTEWAFSCRSILFCGISVEKCTSSSQGTGHWALQHVNQGQRNRLKLAMYQAHLSLCSCAVLHVTIVTTVFSGCLNHQPAPLVCVLGQEGMVPIWSPSSWQFIGPTLLKGLFFFFFFFLFKKIFIKIKLN